MNTKEIKAAAIYSALKNTIKWDENNDPSQVDTLDIDPKIIDQIIRDNEEYLIWEDGSEITKDDILSCFDLLKYEDDTYSLGHKKDDFYINDIIF